jgi:DUF4097 and DUF4098 domain-containing protein YvlB
MLCHALRAAALAIFTFAAAWALPSYAISKEFDQKYPLAPGGTFELQNVNGTVEVEGWDRNVVEVHAVKIAKHRESDLERVSIEVDAKPAAISVATHYPPDEGVEVSVEYTIHVPRSARLEHLGTVNGSLRVASVDNIEELHAVNGNIEVFEGGGSLRARTTNGNVRMELVHVREHDGVTAETTNGSVILAVPLDTHADLETRCMNGSFSSELPVRMESTLRPREMHGKIGNGGAPIHLRTVNGGIRLSVLRSTV